MVDPLPPPPQEPATPELCFPFPFPLHFWLQEVSLLSSQLIHTSETVLRVFSPFFCNEGFLCLPCNPKEGSFSQLIGEFGYFVPVVVPAGNLRIPVRGFLASLALSDCCHPAVAPRCVVCLFSPKL